MRHNAMEAATMMIVERTVLAVLDIVENNRPLGHWDLDRYLRDSELQQRVRNLRERLHPGEKWRAA